MVPPEHDWETVEGNLSQFCRVIVGHFSQQPGRNRTTWCQPRAVKQQPRTFLHFYMRRCKKSRINWNVENLPKKQHRYQSALNPPCAQLNCPLRICTVKQPQTVLVINLHIKKTIPICNLFVRCISRQFYPIKALKWGSEYRTSLVLEWSKVVWLPIGSSFECHLNIVLNLVQNLNGGLNT